MAAPDSRFPQTRSAGASVLARAAVVLGAVAYAVVGLGLRLLMARVYFLSGQTKIAGPTIAVPVPGHGEFIVTLPAEIRPTTFELFAKDYSGLPGSSTLAAYLFSYAEFVLPVCLVLGFATRLSALALLTMTATVLVYVSLSDLWTTQVYLIAVLSVLVVVGPGALSVDALIRSMYRN
jgi:putative oxidoreductase